MISFRTRRVAACVALLLLCQLADATEVRADAHLVWQGPFEVAEVRAGDLLTLEDGREVRLAGIGVPQADDSTLESPDDIGWHARRTVEAWVEDTHVRLGLEDGGIDRYGRLLAHVETVDGRWLQGALLAEGHAWVATRADARARARRMLAIEAAARRSGLGVWSAPSGMVRSAARARGGIGRFGIVEGRIREVTRQRVFHYLNFDEDWRTDFTIRVRKAGAKQMAKQGFDVQDLAGKNVRVRGRILDIYGPMVELTHREQIEVLD